MVTAGMSNLALDSVGLLLSIGKGSPIIGFGRRGSSGTVGGVGFKGRGERCVGPATDERLKGGVSIVHRWSRRRQMFDAATLRATAADDVEQEEVVDKAEEEAEEEAASSSKEIPKFSRIEQQQQQRSSRVRKQAGPRTPGIFSNLVEEWTRREKGDVRDVVLMSLSFAVLIYISQHLVHAYCALRHMYYSH